MFYVMKENSIKKRRPKCNGVVKSLANHFFLVFLFFVGGCFRVLYTEAIRIANSSAPPNALANHAMGYDSCTWVDAPPYFLNPPLPLDITREPKKKNKW